MAVYPTTQTGMTLEQFLAWPRIDEKPYLEYIDGQVEEKVSPQTLHGMMELGIADLLNSAARPTRRGVAIPELRCTFAGRSIIPDVVFLSHDQIQVNDRRKFVNEILVAPDIHVEIRSPGQSTAATRRKLEFSLRNGCRLGWYLDPDNEMIDVFRPGVEPERLPADGFLDGAPVLPEFRVAVADVFGCLYY